MNIAILEQKLEALARFPALSTQAIQRFGAIIRQLDGWSLFRINPLRFAKEHELHPSESVDLFLHALKVGMVDLAFQTFCPLCGSVEYCYDALDQIAPNTFFCSTCGGDASVDLDDHILVAFTLNPSIATLPITPYADLESYQRYFFSDVLEYAPERQVLVRHQLRGFGAIEPDDPWELALDAEPGTVYRVVSLDLHATTLLSVVADAPTLPSLDFDLLPGGFVPSRADLPPGRTLLRFHNRANRMLGLYVHVLDHDARNRVLDLHPNRWHSYFSAKMLLNNQTFRELFRVHQLAPSLRLNLQSLTLLFTDLQDSTRLYGEVGDAFAYGLVQEHFNLLTQAVRNHGGAVVKTMGDAVMATFNEPQEGVHAALEMLHAIERLNARIAHDGYRLELKVGVHEGAALAVNSDERLDYFGQSVNIAARIQALAHPGELWISEAVFTSPGVEALLSDVGCSAGRQSASLKGVSELTTVYQCAVPRRHDPQGLG